MHSFRRRAALLLLASVWFPGATTLAAQGSEWRFSAQSAAPITLPSWLASDSLRTALSYNQEPAGAVAGFLADLNLDGTFDYVLRASLEVCGSNCEYLLVDGQTRSALGRVGGSVLVVGPRLVNGYPVIQAYGHSSADSGRWSTSVFDGERYVAVSTIYLEGESLTRLFETLRDIRFWPPPDKR